jgi:hypothetical protein
MLPALLLIPLGAAGQEAIRMSLTSAEAAELRRKAATTLGYYNLKMGPTMWNFAGTLDTEFSDNIRLESSDLAKADVSFRPRIDTRMLWPITDRNSLNLRFGGGYAFYTTYTAYNRYFITPGTELSFDLYVGKVWLNFHERVSITENSYQDPTVVGTADYSRLENTLGLTAVWDLNRIILRGGYDHANYVNLQSSGSAYPDGQSDMLFVTAGYLLKPQMTVGTEFGGGFITYDRVEGSLGFNEAIQWSMGGFYEAQLTEYIKGRIGLGYSSLLPQGASSDMDDNSGFYGQATLFHRVNQQVDYSLGASREVTVTSYGGTLDMYSLRLRTNLRVIQKTVLYGTFTFEHGDLVYSTSEVFDRFGPGLGLSRRLGEKVTASASYRFYWRDSNYDSGDYTVNIFTLGLQYQF